MNTQITVDFLSEQEKALINNNWNKDILKAALHNADGAHIIISADKKSAWLITSNSKDFDYAYDSVEELIDDLVKQNDYKLRPVATKLGVSVIDLWENKDKAINDIYECTYSDGCQVVYLDYLLQASK